MHTAPSHYIYRVADRDVTMLADKIGAAHRQTGAINLKKPTRFFRSFVRPFQPSFGSDAAAINRYIYSAELNCLYLFLGGKSDDSLFFDACTFFKNPVGDGYGFMLPKGPISRLISYHVETTILEKSIVQIRTCELAARGRSWRTTRIATRLVLHKARGKLNSRVSTRLESGGEMWRKMNNNFPSLSITTAGRH